MLSEHDEYTQITWACSAQSSEMLPKTTKRKDNSAEIARIKGRINREFD